MQKMVSALCLLLPLLGGSSCPAAPSTEPKRLRVLTSFLPVYCFAANVAGDRALVENLLPANVGPHDYQFSRRDLEKVSRADLIDRRATDGPFATGRSHARRPKCS